MQTTLAQFNETESTDSFSMQNSKLLKVSLANNTIQAKAGSQWDKLEGIFEARVAKALTNLRVASADEVEALKARVDVLSQKLHRATGRTTAAKTGADSGAAAKAARPATRRSAPRRVDDE